MNQIQKVGLVFGGPSPEHDVSIKSASSIFNAFVQNKHQHNRQIVPFYIDQQGFWYDVTSSIKILSGKLIDEDQKTLKKRFPFAYPEIDLWLPMIHGKFGEDGTLQSILESTDIDYIGSRTLTNSICFDKIQSRNIASCLRVRQPVYLALNHQTVKEKDPVNLICNHFSFPVFVKPSGTGSSIGITKVREEEDIMPAIKKAFKIDDRIIVEECIDDIIEVECGMIGKEKKVISEPGEVFYREDFYDTYAKYEDDETRCIVPAGIRLDAKKRIRDLTLVIATFFGVTDMARIDFFVKRKNSEIYWNEINTIPGLTEKSMFPRLWHYEGINMFALINRIIDEHNGP